MSAVNFLILDKEQDRSAKCFMALKQVCINEPFLTIVHMFLYDLPIFYEFPLFFWIWCYNLAMKTLGSLLKA